jgi:uncharacterized protein with ParB-like and HNH nuclease domain
LVTLAITVYLRGCRMIWLRPKHRKPTCDYTKIDKTGDILQTSPVRLIDYFDGRKQSVIPLFQRPYTWQQKPNWETLWQDILDCFGSEGKLEPHFMGAIVSLPVSTTPIGVNKHLIIDGQQRLTTISVLLCALRGFLDDKVKERIQDFLINRHDEGIDRYKLAPTQADRNAYEAIVSDKANQVFDSQLLVAHIYFKKQLASLDGTDGDPGPLQILEIIESALRVVMISLDPEHEDPYEIFESLNFKGTPLTPADLVRNYILMKYRHSLGEYGDQTRIYNDYWKSIEDNCGKDLPQFLMHYCRLSGREVRKKSIYPAFKSHVEGLDPEQLEAELHKIRTASQTYPGMLHPELTKDEKVRRPLKVFKMLGMTVFYPVLMRAFLAERQGTISTSELYETLDILDAYLIRRSVCNLKNNALDSLVTLLLKDWPDAAPSNFLKSQLSKQTGNLRWPRDPEFIESFINDAQYGRKSTNWVLWRIEESHAHKEALVDENIQIEHILPQTPSQDWLSALTDDDKARIDRWVDTYGNLTLTGYNGELSNKSFVSKREIYMKSHFEINKTLANEAVWNIASIRRRGESLAQMALKVWQGPTTMD